MTAKYTAAELKLFDRLTQQMSSINQLERINGRLAVRKFEAKHGKEKCQAMYEELQRRDRARR